MPLRQKMRQMNCGASLDVIIDIRLKPCVEAQEKAEKTAWDLMQDADLNPTQTQRK